MKKVVITCGLISGAIVAAVWAITAVMYNSNPEFDSGMVIGYATQVLAFSLIFVGIKIYRDKHNGGVVSFGKAFQIGLFITLIASTIYVAGWAIEYNYVFPDFMEKYTAHMIRELKTSGASQARIDATIKEMEMYHGWYKNPFLFALMTYAEIVPTGLIITLICALILKRKENKRQPIPEAA